MGRILRIREVQQLVGLSASTLWRLERQGSFPQRLRLSVHSVGWAENEVLEWLAARKRGAMKTPGTANA